MSFYRDTVRTARKDHKCELCGAIIRKGEKYHDKAGNEFGDIFYTKECEKCQAVLNEFCKSQHYQHNEGYTKDWMQEWWIDEKCRECKNYYPLCKPDSDCDGLEWCDLIDKHNRCTGGDHCSEMTHFCRCEKFEVKGENEV